MNSFLKFSGMISFLMLVVTKYEDWGGDGSTNPISQTK
jgi:hypothetical protein